jgi:hypothetical protein
MGTDMVRPPRMRATAYHRRVARVCAVQSLPDQEVTSVSDDEPAAADTPPPPTPAPGRPPPPPIAWETELSTRSKESESLSSAALDVVRTVIHGQDSD